MNPVCRSALAGLAIAFSSSAALAATTLDGYVACLTEEDLSEWTTATVNGDKLLAADLWGPACGSLKGGRQVSVMETTLEGTERMIRLYFPSHPGLRGLDLWTYIGAVKMEDPK